MIYVLRAFILQCSLMNFGKIHENPMSSALRIVVVIRKHCFESFVCVSIILWTRRQIIVSPDFYCYCVAKTSYRTRSSKQVWDESEFEFMSVN